MGGVVFVKSSSENGKSEKKERFPKKSSIFANPFKVGKDGTRDEVLELYETWIRGKFRRTLSWPGRIAARICSSASPGCCDEGVDKNSVLGGLASGSFELTASAFAAGPLSLTRFWGS